VTDIFTRAIPVVEPPFTGVHLLWTGPPEFIYSPGGWTIERRDSVGPLRAPSVCDVVTATQLNGAEELHLNLGTMIVSPGLWPTLALPLRATVDRLEMGVHRAGPDADLLLIESAEPLPLGGDVSLAMFRLGFGGAESIQPVFVVLDDSQTRALVIPVGATAPIALTPGQYRLGFSLDRARYRASTQDAQSNLSQAASLVLTL
jgi:hypothetical protein